jgi:hypothetical protein
VVELIVSPLQYNHPAGGELPAALPAYIRISPVKPEKLLKPLMVEIRETVSVDALPNTASPFKVVRPETVSVPSTLNAFVPVVCRLIFELDSSTIFAHPVLLRCLTSFTFSVLIY